MLEVSNGQSSPRFQALVGSFFTLIVLLFPAPSAAQTSGGGGASGSKFWVHARLGQPSSLGGEGSGSATGWSLRYERAGTESCLGAVNGTGDPSLDPWFGVGGDAAVDTQQVTVWRVNRQNSSDRTFLGIGCVNPSDIVPIPTEGEVLELLRSEGLPSPQIVADPEEKGLTGLETRFWYPGSGEEAIEPTHLRDCFFVAAQAQAVEYRWFTGDENIYTTSSPGSSSAPAVKHIYQRKRNPYKLTLEMDWMVEYSWSGCGDSGSGTVGPLTLEGSRDYPVAEVRSVLRG